MQCDEVIRKRLTRIEMEATSFRNCERRRLPSIGTNEEKAA